MIAEFLLLGAAVLTVAVFVGRHEKMNEEQRVINGMNIENFNSVADGFNKLKAQVDDLQRTMKELVEVVEEMNDEIEKGGDER